MVNKETGQKHMVGKKEKEKAQICLPCRFARDFIFKEE
jgi:hypothetical protein